MGINFQKKTHGKKGEIIYPAYNGTNGFWKQSRWDLIMKTDKLARILDVRYIYDFATVRAIQLIQELGENK